MYHTMVVREQSVGDVSTMWGPGIKLKFQAWWQALFCPQSHLSTTGNSSMNFLHESNTH